MKLRAVQSPMPGYLRLWRDDAAGVQAGVSDEADGTQHFSVTAVGRKPTDEEVEAMRVELVEMGELTDAARREKPPPLNPFVRHYVEAGA